MMREFITLLFGADKKRQELGIQSVVLMIVFTILSLVGIHLRNLHSVFLMAGIASAVQSMMWFVAMLKSRKVEIGTW